MIALVLVLLYPSQKLRTANTSIPELAEQSFNRDKFAKQDVGHDLQLKLVALFVLFSGLIVPIQVTVLRKNDRLWVLLFFESALLRFWNEVFNSDMDLNHVGKNLSLAKRTRRWRSRKHRPCLLLLVYGVGGTLISFRDFSLQHTFRRRLELTRGRGIERPCIAEQLQNFRERLVWKFIENKMPEDAHLKRDDGGYIEWVHGLVGEYVMKIAFRRFTVPADGETRLPANGFILRSRREKVPLPREGGFGCTSGRACRIAY